MGQKYKTLTIDDCLARAKWAAVAGYHGVRPSDSSTRPGEPVETEEKRLRLATAALAFSNLAIAMQNERDYEERKVQEIKEQHEGGESDATV